MSDPQPFPGEHSDIELPLFLKLEAMLFVAAEPVTTAQLATALDVAPSVVERGLNELDSSLAARGLRLQRHAGRFQLTTAPELAELVERFLGLEATTHLSRAALETLAIIAYQQPVTRPQIELDPRRQQRQHDEEPTDQRPDPRVGPCRWARATDFVLNHA